MSECNCHQCVGERKRAPGTVPIVFMQMIVCPECGNKRCPKASNHRHSCTRSNEPGQRGSIYGDYVVLSSTGKKIGGGT